MTRRSRSWLPYLLILLAFAFLVLSEAGLLGPFNNALAYIVAPVERGLSGLFQNIGELFKTVRDVRELQETVDYLQEENTALRIENIRLREQYVAENEQLRALLNFSEENLTYSLVGANIVERGCEIYPCGEVLGQGLNPYLRYVIINAGSRDGVAVGMPVIAGGATLVGRVAQVSRQQAYVQLVNDPTSEVAVMLQGSRISGMLISRPDGTLLMTQILPDETVEVGEIVITAGLGGLLPKGLILGQVESITYQEAALFQEAVIRPAIDFRRLEVLLVITDFPRQPMQIRLEEP
ncbi:MAG TPA: rod shape-determining protein MreC [Chloroflexi bacterium]|nr:rod shape-determining protein MreC [Chloroflexota bacterium]